MKISIKATLAALFTQIIFGFSFMFTKIALDYASPMTVIADRYIMAFVGLTAVMVFTRTKIKLNKNIWKPVLMSVFQPVLYFLFESYGIKLTTSSFSSIMISLIPVVSMISGVIFLKEVPALMQYLFTALSVGGVVIMALVGRADGTVTGLGILLLFFAVVSSVAYNVCCRKISSEFGVMERTYAQTVVGLVVFVSIALVENIHAPIKIIANFADLKYTASIFYLGVVSSVAAFMMLNYANTHLPVAKTTAFTNLNTMVSVIAGAVFLHDPVSVWTVVAVVMILVGVWGVQLLDVKRKV